MMICENLSKEDKEAIKHGDCRTAAKILRDAAEEMGIPLRFACTKRYGADTIEARIHPVEPCYVTVGLRWMASRRAYTCEKLLEWLEQLKEWLDKRAEYSDVPGAEKFLDKIHEALEKRYGRRDIRDLLVLGENTLPAVAVMLATAAAATVPGAPVFFGTEDNVVHAYMLFPLVAFGWDRLFITPLGAFSVDKTASLEDFAVWLREIFIESIAISNEY